MQTFEISLTKNGMINVNKLGICFEEDEKGNYKAIISDLQLAAILQHNELAMEPDENAVTIRIVGLEDRKTYGWFI